MSAGRHAAARALLLVAALCGSPRVAHAEERQTSTVLIVFDPHADVVSRRLRQEVEALGLRVKLVPEATAPLSLEQLASSAHALAAIRVQPRAEGGVEMTVLDRATGKTVHRDLLRVEANDAAGEELIATRTVELLRASLLELSSDHPTRGEVSVAPPVTALALREQASVTRRRSGEVFALAGPALLVMPGWRPSWQLALNAGWISSSGLGVEAELDSPVGPARTRHDEGSLEARVTSYRLGALWQVGTSSDALSLRLAAGWSLLALAVHGVANAPYASAESDFVVSAPWLSLAARARLSSHFAWLLQTSAQWALPRAQVRVAGRDVEQLARPTWLVAFGPEVSWP